MTVIEVLKFNRELIKNLRRAGIRLEDADYVELYNDYANMRSKGEKVSYIVVVLAQRYHVCERKVYDLIRRFRAECGGNAHSLRRSTACRLQREGRLRQWLYAPCFLSLSWI